MAINIKTINPHIDFFNVECKNNIIAIQQRSKHTKPIGLLKVPLNGISEIERITSKTTILISPHKSYLLIEVFTNVKKAIISRIWV